VLLDLAGVQELGDAVGGTFANPADLGELLGIGVGLGERLGQVADGAGNFLEGVDPETVAAKNLEDVRHLLEDRGELVISPGHGKSLSEDWSRAHRHGGSTRGTPGLRRLPSGLNLRVEHRVEDKPGLAERPPKAPLGSLVRVTSAPMKSALPDKSELSRFLNGTTLIYQEGERDILSPSSGQVLLGWESVFATAVIPGFRRRQPPARSPASARRKSRTVAVVVARHGRIT
jgi:hypothetical protein